MSLNFTIMKVLASGFAFLNDSFPRKKFSDTQKLGETIAPSGNVATGRWPTVMIRTLSELAAA